MKSLKVMGTRIKSCNTRIIRTELILYIFWSILFVIIIRLFYLQIEQRKVFEQLGEKNFLRVERIYPLRGNLLDSNNVLLASNRPVFDLYWQGLGDKRMSTQHYILLKKVGNIVDKNLINSESISLFEFSERYSRRILLCKNMNFSQLCQISEYCGNSSRLFVDNRFERVYPYGSFASHIVGYLNRIEMAGRTGVERVFQNALHGQLGYVINVINSTGKKLEQKGYLSAKAGKDIKLTLDFEMQRIAESLFSGDQAGAFILMDPENGAVRALISYPNFDPNLFLSPITEEEWNEKLTLNHPLINRATCSLYPPASTFKLVTIAAGLEEKIINPKSEYFCHGFIEFGNRKYQCMRHTGHGILTPRQALVVSCNVLCFEIGKRIKINTLAEYARRFGLGSKTNFLLPEREGLVPTTEWKRKCKGERWWPGDTLSACVGQSYLLVTPLQLLRMVCSICTGDLVRPRILEEEAVERSSIKISKDTLKLLRLSMADAVKSGTVHLLNAIKDFEIHAKTGTAQTCSLEKEKTSKELLDHGWVTGYFKYKDEKPLAFIVFVENAGSSHPAIQIADKFLRAYKTFRENLNLQKVSVENIKE
jgi:penicillin-binding protein 2